MSVVMDYPHISTDAQGIPRIGRTRDKVLDMQLQTARVEVLRTTQPVSRADLLARKKESRNED